MCDMPPMMTKRCSVCRYTNIITQAITAMTATSSSWLIYVKNCLSYMCVLGSREKLISMTLLT